MEIIIIAALVGILTIVALFFGLKKLIGVLLVGIPAKILSQFVEEHSRTEDIADPEKPIHPSTDRKSSEFMAELAVQAKADKAPNRMDATEISKPPSHPPELVQKSVPVMSQPVMSQRQSAQVVNEPQPQDPAMTVNPLVENDMPQQPVINAQSVGRAPEITQEDLQNLADDNVYIPPKSDKLKYGVRNGSYSPNRILRDKRYERNAAN